MLRAGCEAEKDTNDKKFIQFQSVSSLKNASACYGASCDAYLLMHFDNKEIVWKEIVNNFLGMEAENYLRNIFIRVYEMLSIKCSAMVCSISFWAIEGGRLFSRNHTVLIQNFHENYTKSKKNEHWMMCVFSLQIATALKLSLCCDFNEMFTSFRKFFVTKANKKNSLVFVYLNYLTNLFLGLFVSLWLNYVK